MAATGIVVTKLRLNCAADMPAAAAVDAVDGAAVDMSGCSDSRVLIILENAAAAQKTATVEAGDGLQGIYDLEVTLPASGRVCLNVETMKYLKMSGENRGRIVIRGSDTNVKVAAVELP